MKSKRSLYCQVLNENNHTIYAHPVHQELVKKEFDILTGILDEALSRRTEMGIASIYATALSESITAAKFKHPDPDFARYWFCKGLRITLQPTELYYSEAIALEKLLFFLFFLFFFCGLLLYK